MRGLNKSGAKTLFTMKSRPTSFPAGDPAMTSLDARALTTDPDGLQFLQGVLGDADAVPSLEARFGVTARPVRSDRRRRREAGPTAAPAQSDRAPEPAAA